MMGKFIVVEGMDGAGKSTHLSFLKGLIEARGHRVVLTREPGGSPLAETLRELVLHQDMDGLTELLLVFAARRDHLMKTVWPALRAGSWVLSDRYLDSSWAYQGAGRGLDQGLLSALTRQVEAEGRGPDQVFYFDLPAEMAAARRAARAQSVADQAPPSEDRFEQEDLAFFERVREGYRQAAAGRGERAVWIDSRNTIEDIQKLLSERLVSE